MAGLMALAGLGMSIGGGIMGANEASRVANIMRHLPEYQKVDIKKETEAGLAEAKATLPAATELAGAVNQANVSAMQKMYGQISPDWQRMLRQAEQLIGAQLGGQVMSEDAARVLSKTAAKSLGKGLGGSLAQKYTMAKELGLFGAQQQQAGMQNLLGYTSTLRSVLPEQMNAGAWILPIGQRLQFQTAQNELAYQSALTRAFGKTTPGASAYWGNWLTQTGGALMGGGLTGMMGGGGGMASAGGGSANIFSNPFGSRPIGGASTSVTPNSAANIMGVLGTG